MVIIVTSRQSIDKLKKILGFCIGNVGSYVLCDCIVHYFKQCLGNFTSHGFKNCSVFSQPSIITVEVTHFTGVIPHSMIYSFAFPQV